MRYSANTAWALFPSLSLVSHFNARHGKLATRTGCMDATLQSWVQMKRLQESIDQFRSLVEGRSMQRTALELSRDRMSTLPGIDHTCTHVLDLKHHFDPEVNGLHTATTSSKLSQCPARRTDISVKKDRGMSHDGSICPPPSSSPRKDSGFRTTAFPRVEHLPFPTPSLIRVSS